MESSDWQRNSEAQLHEALADLDERSRDILAQRWLAEEKATLHELAAQYERVRRAYPAAGAECDEKTADGNRRLIFLTGAVAPPLVITIPAWQNFLLPWLLSAACSQ